MSTRSTSKIGGSFRLNDMFKSKNGNNKMVEFYDKNVQLENLTYPKTSSGFRVGTINAHGFIAVNKNHTAAQCVTGLIEFMIRHSIDILGVQEYNSKHHSLLESLIQSHGLYSTILTGWSYMNLIISKYPLYGEETITLPGGDHRTLVRVTVQIGEDEWQIGTTHLSILPRNYDRPDSDMYRESVTATIEMHREQLAKIKQYPLDILMGDFNFNTNEPEYGWMHEDGWNDESESDPTTPFETTVDFVWTRKPNPGAHVLYSVFTDHRPVIKDINLQT